MNITLSKSLSIRSYEARFEYLEFSKEEQNQIYFSILELIRDLRGCSQEEINWHLFGYGENSQVLIKYLHQLENLRLIKKISISPEKEGTEGFLNSIRHLFFPDPYISVKENGMQ